MTRWLWVALLSSTGCGGGQLSVAELNDLSERGHHQSMQRVTVTGIVREVKQMASRNVRDLLDQDAGQAVQPDLSSAHPLVIIEDDAGRAELWFDPNDNALVQRFASGQKLTASCRFDRYDAQRQLTILDGCRPE